jgi:hypothetical protein
MGNLALGTSGSKNKVDKRGTFFSVQKVTAKTPRQPHNSPYCHHNFTITKQHKIKNPLTKPHLHHEYFF